MLMMARALISFLLLPGIMAVLIPAWIVTSDGRRGSGNAAGILVAAAGSVLMLWCIKDFLVVGRGTLAPWDPPKRLVIVGPYRWLRNPMYLGVLLLVCGWSIASGSCWLWAYSAALGIMFHLRVILGEEPSLKQRYGKEWTDYQAAVWRWIPKFPGGRSKSRRFIPPGSSPE